MSQDLTPEEYLKQLQEGGSAAPPEFTPPPAHNLMQPGQTLRQVLSEEEIAGLRAFTLRTGGPEGVLQFERELDVPYDPVADEAAARAEADRLYAEAFGIQQAMRPKNTWKGGLIAAFLIFGILATIVFFSESAEDTDNTRSLEEASGAQLARGKEAVAATEKFKIPETWKERAEPEISMSGDDESSYAFYNLAWELPQGTTAKDFQDWFKAQPEVEVRPADASCEVEIKEEEASCEVEFYQLDVKGSQDYDKPRQTVTFNFYTTTAEGEKPVVFAEAYATD